MDRKNKIYFQVFLLRPKNSYKVKNVKIIFSTYFANRIDRRKKIVLLLLNIIYDYSTSTR